METLLFAFGNQKGGVGKSTLSTVFGNYIHTVHSEQYLFSGIDGDDLQRSYFGFRCRDLEIDRNTMTSEELMPLLMDKEREYNLYHIIQVSSANFKDDFLEKYNGLVDMMVIDLPGNLKQVGVMDSYTPVEVLFVPLNPINDVDLDATVEFLKQYKQVDKLRADIGLPPADKYLIRSKRDRRAKYDHQAFLDRFAPFNITYLEEEFPYSPTFGRDVNTLLEFKKNIKDTETEALCKKLFEIVENKYKQLNN